MKTIENGKYKIEICEDWDKFENPCEETDIWNGFKFLLNPTSRYFYPSNCSENLYDYIDGDSHEKDFRKLERIFGKGNVFTLSATIHSGIYLHFGKINSNFDCGVLGFIVLNPKESRKIVKYSKKFTKEMHAKEFVAAWNHYMNEPNYRAEFYEKVEFFDAQGNPIGEDWELKDSISGFDEEETCEIESKIHAKYIFGNDWDK